MSVKLTEQQELEVEICFVQRELELQQKYCDLCKLQRKPNPTLVSVLSQLRQKHAKLTATNYVIPKAVPA